MGAAEKSKDKRNVMLQILNTMWNAVVSEHLKECRKGKQINSWTFPTKGKTIQ
jgi:hypothetical protein